MLFDKKGEPLKKGGALENLDQVVARFQREATRYSPTLIKNFTSSEIAQKIAKTENKKSLAYKAAIQSVGRYKRGARKASADQKTKIEKALRALVIEQPNKLAVVLGATKITISGQIGYSSESRRRTVSQDLDEEQTAQFFDLAKQEEPYDVMDFFFASYLEGMTVELDGGYVEIESRK